MKEEVQKLEVRYLRTFLCLYFNSFLFAYHSLSDLFVMYAVHFIYKGCSHRTREA
jgi:hypothetical protein